MRDLTRHVTRATIWAPVLALGVATLAVAALSPEPLGESRLRSGGLLVAAVTGFALVDPAGATLASTPTSLARRRAHRVILTAAVGAAVWAAALFAVGPASPGRLTLEFAAYVAVALAVAGATSDGVAGAVAVLAVAWSTVAVPWRWWPIPSHPYEEEAVGAIVRLAVLALLLLAWNSRDPARRSH